MNLRAREVLSRLNSDDCSEEGSSLSFPNSRVLSWRICLPMNSLRGWSSIPAVEIEQRWILSKMLVSSICEASLF